MGDLPDTERIKARLANLNTEMIFIFGYMKVMLICNVLFNEADEDESGALNPEETKKVIKTVCENNEYECPPDDALDEFIKEIGGEVTFDMFCSVAVPRILALSGIEIVEDSE